MPPASLTTPVRAGRRRGVPLQRHDIPMRQSQDYPTTDMVELLAPPEEAEEEKK